MLCGASFFDRYGAPFLECRPLFFSPAFEPCFPFRSLPSLFPQDRPTPISRGRFPPLSPYSASVDLVRSRFPPPLLLFSPPASRRTFFELVLPWQFASSSFRTNPFTVRLVSNRSFDPSGVSYNFLPKTLSPLPKALVLCSRQLGWGLGFFTASSSITSQVTPISCRECLIGDL